MATEKFSVIEGDGSANEVTLTNDPVENATVQAVKSAIGSQGDASETDTSTDASLLSWLQGIIDILTSGLEIDSWTAGTISAVIQSLPSVTIGTWNAGSIGVSSLPTPVVVDATGQGDLPITLGGETIDVSSFPSSLVNNNDELKTSASLSASSVQIEADDSQGNGVQAIERVDGENILKVADMAVLEVAEDAVEAVSAADKVSWASAEYAVQQAHASSTGGSNAILLDAASLGSGENFVVLSLEVTTDTQQVVEVQDGTTTVDSMFADAYSGMVKDPSGPVLEASDGNSVNIVVGSGGVRAHCSYIIV